jgi:hypothetical protein
MAKARDLLNSSGGSGFLPKPGAKKPLIAKPEDLDEQNKAGAKVDAKQKLARGKGGGGSAGAGGGGASIPTGVRPKV